VPSDPLAAVRSDRDAVHCPSVAYERLFV
jgi:hypothetical protein